MEKKVSVLLNITKKRKALYMEAANKENRTLTGLIVRVMDNYCKPKDEIDLEGRVFNLEDTIEKLNDRMDNIESQRTAATPPSWSEHSKLPKKMKKLVEEAPKEDGW